MLLPKPYALLFMTISLLAILAGCTPDTSAVTTTMTVTATAVLPTLTPTTPSPTMTATATMTIPPSPTAAPSPVPTLMAVPPTPTMEPSSTPTDEIFQERESISPAGRWQAHTILTYVQEEGMVTGYQTDLTVTETEGDTTWTAYATLQGAGLGYQVPTVLLWSPDEQSLFFTLRATPDGCSTFIGRFDSGLYQLDLTTGAVEQLPVNGRLAPDGRRLARLVWEPNPAIQIDDLTGAPRHTIPLNTPLDRDTITPNLVWSPDGQAIALEAADGPCVDYTTYSLLLFDLATTEPTTLLWQASDPFRIIDWPQPDAIHLQSMRFYDQIWTLDVATGDLTLQE